MDRYGSDVLSGDWRAPKRGRAVPAAADLGLVVEEVTDDWVGEIVAVDRDLHTVTLEDRRRRRRTFPLGPGFLPPAPALEQLQLGRPADDEHQPGHDAELEHADPGRGLRHQGSAGRSGARNGTTRVCCSRSVG